jgi:hypothetical protein
MVPRAVVLVELVDDEPSSGVPLVEVAGSAVAVVAVAPWPRRVVAVAPPPSPVPPASPPPLLLLPLPPVLLLPPVSPPRLPPSLGPGVGEDPPSVDPMVVPGLWPVVGVDGTVVCVAGGRQLALSTLVGPPGTAGGVLARGGLPPSVELVDHDHASTVPSAGLRSDPPWFA